MRNIIVIAYQLHYNKGSECSVGWDYIQNMSKNNHLFVIYGSSGDHHDIGNTKELEEYTQNHIYPNITFIPVKPSFVSHNWDYTLKGAKRFYEEYRKWHEDVYNEVKEILNNNKIDIIHFVEPIGYHEPGILYKLPVPYIWGPIGGMGTVPTQLLLTSDIVNHTHSGLSLIIKNKASHLRLRLNKRVKEAMRESDVVICAVSKYSNIIERVIGKKHHSVIKYLPENCMKDVYDLNLDKYKSEKINMICIGRLDSGKAPMIILEALKRMGEKAKSIHVDFLGDGPLFGRCQAFIQDNSLEDVVTLHGKVSRDTVFKMMSNAQMMLFSSLKESNSTVVWEAMAHAVPTLCIDHCGMHDTITESSGIKIPVLPYSQVVRRISEQLQRIVDDPSILKKMADRLLGERLSYTWEIRQNVFEHYYSIAEEQFKKRAENANKTKN